jgi:hypothetical protein
MGLRSGNKKKQQNDSKATHKVEDQDDVLKDFLGSLKEDMQEAKELEKKKKNIQVQRQEQQQHQEQVKRQVELPPPLTHRIVKETYTLNAPLDTEHLKTSVDKRKLNLRDEDRQYVIEDEITSTDFSNPHEDPYSLEEKFQSPVIAKIMERLPLSRDLLIFQIVMGKPKGLQRNIDSHDYF